MGNEFSKNHYQFNHLINYNYERTYFETNKRKLS